jgi:ATP-dependent Clp protease ATP-binding subunit ClpC
MPAHELDLAVLLRSLDDDTFIAEALLYPEVSRLGTNAKSLEKSVVNNAVQLLEQESLLRVWSRLTPAEIEIFELHLELEPSKKVSYWREPIDLRLDVVRWSLSESNHIAFIPALGIEVISNKLTDLIPGSSKDSLLERHARAELQRQGVLVDFKALLLLQRTRGLALSRASGTANIRTPKQVMATPKSEQKKSALEENAIDLTKQRLSPAFEVDEKLTELADALKGKGARSILVVGKAGVGKTALIHELVRRRSGFGFASTPFWATSGARLVAGMTGYGMWQERCDAFWQEAEKTEAIVHFGNLLEFMNTGKSEHSTQGVASFFRQRFARGQALAILECTPEQLPLVEREDPAMLTVLRQLTVEEPTPEASRKILYQVAMRSRTDVSAAGENRRRLAKLLLREEPASPISEAALERLDRLHRRYAGYSAYPARPLRFLRGLLKKSHHWDEQTPEINVGDVSVAFAKETGLPSFLLDEELSFDVDHTTRWFQERVIGQTAAVKLIVDLLATTKAALTRPRRPIASLLFTGPTGTGKTEMAKSLARFFFGDERRMARFDMSEYADGFAVTRLVGGLTGDEGALTARIREQPFSVLLFDEFEKAHSSFFDLLLQMLGDGRLTDGRGRLADFTNSIIVMTSNLGAQGFRRARTGFETEGRDAAFASEIRKAQRNFTHAVQEFLRPEIFNRIDHIVPFVPLDRTTVELITKREIRLVEERHGLRLRGVTLEVSHEAIANLAKRGYDTRYGARTLKRLIERELLTPLATQLNRKIQTKQAKPLKAEVGIDNGRLNVNVTEQTEQAVRSSDQEAAIALRAHLLGNLRRRLVRLDQSPVVLELRNTIWRLVEIERRIAKAARRKKLTKKLVKDRYELQHPWEAVALARLPEYRHKAAQLAGLLEATAKAEDEALLQLYQRDTRAAESEAGISINQLEAELNVLLRQLLDLRHAQPDRITLVIFSENNSALFELSRAYYLAAKASSMKVTVWHYTADIPEELIEEEKASQKARKKHSIDEEADKDKKSKIIEMFDRKVTRLEVTKLSEFFSAKPHTTTAVILDISGQSAFPIYDAEHGLHAFVAGKNIDRLLVHTSDSVPKEYIAPATLARRGSIIPVNYGECRRTYHRTDLFIEDHLLSQRRDWRSDLVEALQAFTEQAHQRAAEKLIDE